MKSENIEGYFDISNLIFSLVVTGIFGGLVRLLLQQVKFPHTVIMMLTGLLFGLLANNFTILKKYTVLASIHPEIIFHVFLPVLIFESSFSMDSHIFKRCFIQCILLAVPGLLMVATLTAVFAVHVYGKYNWDLSTGFIFAFILSATDPVAVVALLKELGTSKILTTIIDGESLLNDGSAIVGFRLTYAILVEKTEITVELIFLQFFKIVICGPLVGFIAGKLIIFCLSRVYYDAIIAIGITLGSAYITYFVAEDILEVSGILAIVILGLVISEHKDSIDIEVEEIVVRFWETLSHLADIIIFMIVGLVIIMKIDIKNISGNEWILIFVTYVGITAIRCLMILSLSLFLSYFGYGIHWKDAIVIAWGGLRGAVSLSLSILLANDKNFSTETGHKILILVSGVVMLTLLLNATTVNFFLNVLGMSHISQGKHLHMANAIKHLQKVQKSSFKLQRIYFKQANWHFVHKFTSVKNLYQHFEQKEFCTSPLSFTSIPYSHSMSILNEEEILELKNDCRLYILNILKMIYWRQFEQGFLARKNVKVLLSAADIAADRNEGFIKIKDLRKQWQVPPILKWLVVRKKFLGLLNMYIYYKLSAGFDIGCSYLVGLLDIMHLINEIIDYPPIAEHIYHIFEQNRLEITKELANFEMNYPFIAMAVKTRRATHYILNELQKEINRLKSTGLLQSQIHENLFAIIEERTRKLYDMPTSLMPLSSKEILLQVDWIVDDELCAYLEERSITLTFDKDMKIHNYGDLPKGLYVILSGIVKVYGKSQLDLNGALPNTDSYYWFSTSKEFEDYLTLGTVLGELGFITEKSFSTTTICKSEVKAFYIPNNVMNQATNISDLIYRIWLSCSVKIAHRVFPQSKTYKDWSFHQIIRHFGFLYLPNLENCLSFNITAGMENVVLIQGIAYDTHTNQKFIAPCHIPQNIGSLIFKRNNITPVLIISGNSGIIESPSEAEMPYEYKFSNRMSIIQCLQPLELLKQGQINILKSDPNVGSETHSIRKLSSIIHEEKIDI